MTRARWWLLGATAAVGVVAVVLMTDKTLNFNGSPKVRQRLRATGVHPRMLAFLDWWEAFGPFPLTVGWKGGLRTDPDEQWQLFRDGKTRAATLDQTPHGRGGALDLYPTINGTVRGLEGDPNPAEAAYYFEEMGRLAEGQGLVWGGHFSSIKDMPHVELPDWRSIPYPPNWSNA